MIARIWQGAVNPSKAAAYHQYLLKTGLKDYAATPGNRGTYLFCRQQEGQTHFQTLTFREDWDAIRKFAGNDFQKARYYSGDLDFLLEMEVLVQHFEVTEAFVPFSPEQRK